MGASSDQGRCAHCGGAIPPRTDSRGRRARYCCGACRAAASRARAAAQAAAQPLDDDRVVGAVEDLAVVAETPPLDPAEFYRARRIVDAAASISEAHRARITTPTRTAPATPGAPSPAPAMSRQQRRAQQRAARKAGR